LYYYLLHHGRRKQLTSVDVQPSLPYSLCHSTPSSTQRCTAHSLLAPRPLLAHHSPRSSPPLNQQLSSLGPSNRNPPQPTPKPFSPGHRSRQLNPAIRNSRIARQIRSPGAPKAQGKARSVASDETRPLSTSPLARLFLESSSSLPRSSPPLPPFPESLRSPCSLAPSPYLLLLRPACLSRSCNS